MASRFQLVIYRLSIASPAIIIFAIVWYSKYNTMIVPTISIIVSLVLVISFVVFFKYAVRHVPSIAINAIEISSADKWIIGYVISYLIPLASIAITDFEPVIALIVSLVIILALPLINSQSPHPLLFICRYHFFVVGTASGVKDYVLISKRNFRNVNQLTSVKRVFEYMLYDDWR